MYNFWHIFVPVSNNFKPKAAHFNKINKYEENNNNIVFTKVPLLTEAIIIMYRNYFLNICRQSSFSYAPDYKSLCLNSNY